MPSRRDGRIEPGQPLKSAISAAAWNRAQDAADMLMGQRPGFTAVPGAAIHAPFTRVKAQWRMGDANLVWQPYTWYRLAPLWLNAPSSATDYFDGIPLFDIADESGASRTHDWSGIGLALEPIRDGAVGWVATSGLCPCRVAPYYGDWVPRTAMPYVEQVDATGTAIASPNTAENRGQWEMIPFPFAGYRIIGGIARSDASALVLVDLSDFWAQPIVDGQVVVNNGPSGGMVVELYLSSDALATATGVHVVVPQVNLRNNVRGNVPEGRFVRLLNPYSFYRTDGSNLLQRGWSIIGVQQRILATDIQGRITNLQSNEFWADWTQPS